MMDVRIKRKWVACSAEACASSPPCESRPPSGFALERDVLNGHERQNLRAQWRVLVLGMRWEGG